MLVQLNQVVAAGTVELLCVYRVHDALLENVVGVLSDTDDSVVECSAPSGDFEYPVHANVGIELTYLPSFTPPKHVMQSTYNRPQITLIPLPVLTSSDQLQVHDQRSFTDLTIFGRFFHDSKGLLCLINSQHKVTALYQSDTVVTCHVQELKFTLKQTVLTVHVSNDNAVSLSNQLNV